MNHHAIQQVHAGHEPEAPYWPVAVPIHQTAAYRFPDHSTALEVPADLVRLSVGVEGVTDLQADLEAALECAA